jgi:isopentenyl phosphate kinase
VFIANGLERSNIIRVLAGEHVGTQIYLEG